MKELKKVKAYVITGTDPHSYSWGSYQYRYINFNVNSKAQNPKVVTCAGHLAKNQVIFTTVKQAINFLTKFQTGTRERYRFEIKEYKGRLQDSIIEAVDTKYGPCYRIVEKFNKVYYNNYI